MGYFNEHGLLNARTYEKDQNGLLRLAYYHYACYGYTSTTKAAKDAMKAIDLMYDNGRFSQHPDTHWKQDPASHDEMTAILYFIANIGDLQSIKKIKIWSYIKYPQFIFFLWSCKYPSNRLLHIISGLIIYLGIRKKKKAKNGRWDTDSELLAILKHQTLNASGVSLNTRLDIMIKNRMVKNWIPVSIASNRTLFSILIKEMCHDEPKHPLIMACETSSGLTDADIRERDKLLFPQSLGT